MTANPMTALQVMRALYRHYSGRYAVATEITDPESGRRIDVLLVNASEQVAIEVKVTRGDFLADIRRPEKQAPWRDLTDRHTYAVPEGLVRGPEVPGDSGLLYVTETGAVKAAKPMRRRGEHREIPPRLQLTAWWRAARAEAVLKGIDYDARELDGRDLRGEVRRLQHDLAVEHGKAERLADERDRWRRAYAAHGDPACGTCGRPLRPARPERWATSSSDWQHRQPADDKACEALRRAAAEAAAADRHLVWVRGPEPAELRDDVQEAS